MVDQAAGGGDEHIERVGEQAELRAVADAADDHAAADARVLGEQAGGIGDLLGEFTRGRKNKHPWAVAALLAGAAEDFVQRGQHEGGGFAAAGLGAGHCVLPLQNGGDGLRLDRGWGSEVAFGQCFEQVGVEVERAESHCGFYLMLVRRWEDFTPIAAVGRLT